MAATFSPENKARLKEMFETRRGKVERLSKRILHLEREASEHATLASKLERDFMGTLTTRPVVARAVAFHRKKAAQLNRGTAELGEHLRKASIVLAALQELAEREGAVEAHA